MAEHTVNHNQSGAGTAFSEAARPSAVAIATNWLGAVVSIFLVGGLGLWGYQLAVRDVRDIPVVRALDGAMRVQPADPGGQTAAHQGLAVNTVQSEGGVENPAVKVVLAPKPVGLTVEDLELVTQRPLARDVEAVPEPTDLTDVSAEITTPDVSDQTIALLTQSAVAQGDAARLAGMPGVKRSPRPRARVAALNGLVEATMAADGTGGGLVKAVDADPSTIAAGTRLVQLGAFDDRAAAEKEWGHILDKHGDLIGGRQRLILLAESGGRNFYRLRVVGFNDLSDSRGLCSALVARGTPCIPVTAR